jgi:hypothetical protein
VVAGEGASVAATAVLGGWNVLGAGTTVAAGVVLPPFLHVTKHAGLDDSSDEPAHPVAAGCVGFGWCWAGLQDEDEDSDGDEDDGGRASAAAASAATRAAAAAAAYAALQEAVTAWSASARAAAAAGSPLSATSATEAGKAVAAAAGVALKLPCLATSGAASAAACMRAGVLALQRHGSGAGGARAGPGASAVDELARFRDGVLAIVRAIGADPTPSNLRHMALEVKSFKYAEHRSFADCLRVLLPFVVATIPLLPSAPLAEYTRAAARVFTAWADLFKLFVNTVGACCGARGVGGG